MFSFVALRAKVNQSLSIAFSDASTTPHFWCFFFRCPANRARFHQVEENDAGCFVFSDFFCAAQQSRFDSNVRRARCVHRRRSEGLEESDAGRFVLLLSESISIPRGGRVRCELLWVCWVGFVLSRSISIP